VALKTLSETWGRLPGFEHDVNRAPRRHDFLPLEDAVRDSESLWGHRHPRLAQGEMDVPAGCEILGEHHEWAITQGDFRFIVRNSAGPRVHKVVYKGSCIYERRKPLTQDSLPAWASMRIAVRQGARNIRLHEISEMTKTAQAQLKPKARNLGED